MKYKEYAISVKEMLALLAQPNRQWKPAEANYHDKVTGELIEVHADGHVTYWKLR